MSKIVVSLVPSAYRMVFAAVSYDVTGLSRLLEDGVGQVAVARSSLAAVSSTRKPSLVVTMPRSSPARR